MEPPGDRWITVEKNKPKSNPNEKYVPKLPKLSASSDSIPTKPYYKPSPFSSKGEYNGTKSNFYKGKKKPYTVVPEFNSPEEEAKFKALQQDIPHLVMPGYIRHLQQTIRIDMLSEKFLSDEWIEIQRNGWKFVKVIKPDDDSSEIPETDDYDLQELGNKWGDFVLFQKVK